jgi:hypothetical protein
MLMLRPTKGFGPDQFSVFAGDRKIGRIYKTEQDDWFWGVDWFEANQQLITGYAATPDKAFAEFKAAWARNEDRARFEAAWGGVAEAVSRRPSSIDDGSSGLTIG